MLSFGGRRNSNTVPKVTRADLADAAKDKNHKRMTSKANPNVAVGELEPVAQALQEPTMQSNLRGMAFNDQFGNPITDPDRSNPTRPRLERPLDTIRSFEAAIDGSYNQRRMSRVTEPTSPAQSRPSSYYPGVNNNYAQRFPGEGSHHGNRMAHSRPESLVDPHGPGNRRSPMPFGSQRRTFGPRNSSDPIMYGHNGNGMMYSSQRRNHHQPAYDTATQGSSSGGSHGVEPWSNSTDPSSEASSVERFQQQPPPPPKPDLGEQYGFSGFGGAPNGFENGPDHVAYGPGPNGFDRRPQPPRHQEMPPPPPPHFSDGGAKVNTLQRRPTVPLQEIQPPQAAAPHPGTGEKRKSWLMRRFSKNN
ncbi:MAG: hypothetical protein LQ340_007623 [Diploschistes diacapsis]|nr:MAG: hypothetical protein LQ340_007623 [Diploschistes diacapsis]